MVAECLPAAVPNWPSPQRWEGASSFPRSPSIRILRAPAPLSGVGAPPILPSPERPRGGTASKAQCRLNSKHLVCPSRLLAVPTRFFPPLFLIARAVSHVTSGVTFTTKCTTMAIMYFSMAIVYLISASFLPAKRSRVPNKRRLVYIIISICFLWRLSYGAPIILLNKTIFFFFFLWMT